MLAALSSETVEYNGERVPLWKATDYQRRLERSVKASKRELVALDEAIKNANGELKTGLQADFEHAAQLLKKREAKLKDLCNQTGLYYDSSRCGVFSVKTENGIKSWGRSAAQKAVAANKNLIFIQNDAIIKKNSGLPKKVQLSDEKIKQTVNVSVGTIQGIVPKGATATNVYTMAGKGTSTPIRDLKRLHTLYGGNPEKWEKKSADVYTDNYKYVVHWYENESIAPKAEFKIKGLKRR